MDIKLGIVVDAAKAVSGSRTAQKAIKGIGTAASTASSRILGAASSLLRLTTAATSLTAVGLAPSFLRTASSVEQLNLRMSTLLGSVEEGARLFDDMNRFASRVPHQFEDIMASATQLSGVMQGGVDEINKWMPMISDLAAVSGLGIQQTTEQVVRMYSAGAASADLFRERGITAMLGFQAGVSVSAEDTRARLIAAFEDPASKFRGASELLANTWSGTLSMMRDKWFNFQKEFSQRTGLFDYFKAIATVINDGMGTALENSKSRMAGWGATTIEVFKRVAMSTAALMDALSGPFGLIKTAVQEIWDGFKKLPPWAQEVGIVGALVLGKKGVAALAAASVLMEKNRTTAAWFGAFVRGESNFAQWLTTGNEKAAFILAERKRDLEGIKKATDEIAATPLYEEGSSQAKVAAGFKAVDAALVKMKESQAALANMPAATAMAVPGQNTAVAEIAKEQREADLAQWRSSEAEKLTAIEESFMTRMEREQMFFDNRQTMIDNAYLNEQISTKRHDTLIAKESARHETAVRKFKQQSLASQLTAYGTFFNSMMALSQGQSKGLFKVMKLGAVATATIDSYNAFTAALKNPPGPPYTYPIAAAALAAGLAKVQAINSTSYGGAGGAGGVGAGGGVMPQPIPSVPTESLAATDTGGQNVVKVEILGDIYGFDDYVEEKLIKAIKEAVDDRDVVLISSDSRNAQEIMNG